MDNINQIKGIERGFKLLLMEINDKGKNIEIRGDIIEYRS